MWIVRLALRRPYSIGVACILIFLMGFLCLKDMPVDIFPVIDIPVVGVIWSYPGLSTEDVERRVVLPSERSLSTTVGGISRIESESLPGIGFLRVYFQQGTNIGSSIAQISAVSSTILKILPPGMQPPVIVQFNASSVPVVQMTMSSDTIPEEKIYDYALNFITLKLFTIPGSLLPGPVWRKSPTGQYRRGSIANVGPRAFPSRRRQCTDQFQPDSSRRHRAHRVLRVQHSR